MEVFSENMFLFSDANFPKIFGNPKIWKFGRKFPKILDIWKYENSTQNFQKYTYFHTYSLNSQIMQWFWLEIPENMCMLCERLWVKIGITHFFRKYDQTPLALLWYGKG